MAKKDNELETKSRDNGEELVLEQYKLEGFKLKVAAESKRFSQQEKRARLINYVKSQLNEK